MRLFLLPIVFGLAVMLGGCGTIQNLVQGKSLNLATVLEDIRMSCGFIADPGPIQQLINLNPQLTSADAVAKLACGAVLANLPPTVTRNKKAPRGTGSGLVGGVVITGHFQ